MKRRWRRKTRNYCNGYCPAWSNSLDVACWVWTLPKIHNNNYIYCTANGLQFDTFYFTTLNLSDLFHKRDYVCTAADVYFMWTSPHRESLSLFLSPFYFFIIIISRVQFMQCPNERKRSPWRLLRSAISFCSLWIHFSMQNAIQMFGSQRAYDPKCTDCSTLRRRSRFWIRNRFTNNFTR